RRDRHRRNGGGDRQRDLPRDRQAGPRPADHHREAAVAAFAGKAGTRVEHAGSVGIGGMTMTDKHPKSRTPTDKDLRENPGIGSSPGTSGYGDELDGENTFRGDVENDTTPQGGIDPDRRVRTNK